jgi:hypothetical protein
MDRVTMETTGCYGGLYRFVFFRQMSEEKVRCFYPNGEHETVTLDYFVSVMRAEQDKRRDLLAYRRRNKKEKNGPTI